MKKISAFARNVRSFRKELGLSQYEFAEKLNVTMATASNYERGKTVPHISQIEDIIRFAYENGKKYGYDYLLGLNFDDLTTLNQYEIGGK